MTFDDVLQTQKVPFGVRGRSTKAGDPNASVPSDQFTVFCTLSSDTDAGRLRPCASGMSISDADQDLFIFVSNAEA